MIVLKTGLDDAVSGRVQHTAPLSQRKGADGMSHLWSSGDLTVEISLIKQVTVEHIEELAAHEITKIYASKSHYLRFHGGSTVRLIYTLDGTLIELTTEGLAISVYGQRLVLSPIPTVGT